jgi:hypothetical protein
MGMYTKLMPWNHYTLYTNYIYTLHVRLGLLAVSGVPGVADIRQRFLPFGKKYVLFITLYEFYLLLDFRIAELPDDKKAKMEDPGSFYS